MSLRIINRFKHEESKATPWGFFCYITASLRIVQNLLTALLLKTGRMMVSSCCYRLAGATAQQRKETAPGSQHHWYLIYKEHELLSFSFLPMTCLGSGSSTVSEVCN